MRCIEGLSAMAIVLALSSPLVRAGEPPEPIDLSSFGHLESGPGTGWDAMTERAEPAPAVPVVYGLESAATRLYVSGIVGASFATVATGGSSTFADGIQQTGSVNETIFTGGGAIGLALSRQSGLLRMEVEGRARGPMTGQSFLVADGGGLPLDASATNGWSTLTNFWRDFFLTDTAGVYAGGGFGVGGYRYTLADAQAVGLSGGGDVTTFAWQVGTGFVYRVSDRVTIDTGYRFFAMTPQSTTIFIDAGPGDPTFGIGTFSSAFSASELLLSIRIYEPFRGWR